jgi:hypothetical protein
LCFIRTAAASSFFGCTHFIFLHLFFHFIR